MQPSAHCNLLIELPGALLVCIRVLVKFAGALLPRVPAAHGVFLVVGRRLFFPNTGAARDPDLLIGGGRRTLSLLMARDVAFGRPSASAVPPRLSRVTFSKPKGKLFLLAIQHRTRRALSIEPSFDAVIYQNSSVCYV